MLAVLVFILFVTNHAVCENCKEAELYCAIPNQKRKVNGVDVHRDCWQYKYKMNCGAISKNDCSSIPTDKCQFVEEKCGTRVKEGDLEFCANWIRSFSCEKQIKYTEEKTHLKKNGETLNSKELLCNAMCLDGNCDAVKKANVEENNELAKSVGMLNAVADIKKGLGAGNNIINIFKGDTKECSFHPLSFMQCCRSSPKGWGEAIGLGKCSSDELNLSKLRAKKQCVEIGVYCKKKVLTCIDKRRVFCCYGSVIARILNQEAKKQLGRGYGSPQSPDCSGIELSDLEKVDLTKADFSDFYNEVVIPNIKIPDIKAESAQIKTKAEDVQKFSATAPDEKKGFNQEALGRLD